MNVAQWLNAIGLGQYEADFRENKIDFDVLADLSDGDLQELGAPLGDRRRLLRAIAELGAQQPLTTQARRTPAAPAPAQSFAQLDSAERRPITVMFCDLVGSTELAAALDVEDWRNLLNSYLDEASRAVTALGGHVLKMLGDGLMAVFGYPRAQENDAERAVRAALAIQRALADLNARNAKTGAPALAARVGLDMGPVVVDAAGEVFGDAPNVAARVQSAAEPGTVLVTARVQRQTAGLFVVEDRGAHHLKGVPAPVALYRIVRASGGRRGGARILTPLVGREEELSQLQRRWSRARRRRPVCPDRRRARHRKVASDRGIPRKARRNAAHLGRMGRLAAPAEHAPASARRMGQTTLWRRRPDRRGASRRPREHSWADRH
jgi:class 3 adenylate cyclase